ncbi:hypothetical protein ACH47B_06445 [Rhodococcus sp. NPDC019627]|uniref:hypothetical protein n=1 Tax=unclassified Rhodococcus (in: high G+C Gram-positive bacteria) TaxID=192944 RepID=UPI0037A0F107
MTGPAIDQDGFQYAGDLVTLAQNEGMDDEPDPTAAHRGALNRVRSFRTELELHRRRAEQLEDERDDAVRDALEAGVSVIQAADAAGLTKWRVYQIRDRRR